MSKSRASIFGGDDTETLDVASFAPKTEIDVKAPPADQVRAVSQAAKFTSREPNAVKAEPKVDKAAKRAPRRYRTGRNQLSVKALPQTVEAFYAITDREGWVLGYTLQRALEALQRELKLPK
jgi:hypothetical protein